MKVVVAVIAMVTISSFSSMTLMICGLACNTFSMEKYGIKCGTYAVPYETGLCFVYNLWPNGGILWSLPFKVTGCFLIFNAAIHSYAMPFFSNHAIYSHRFPLYACLINLQWNGAALNIWAFIDGTLHETCRPCLYQRLYSSGHK
jgi:hypothetical protein